MLQLQQLGVHSVHSYALHLRALKSRRLQAAHLHNLWRLNVATKVSPFRPCIALFDMLVYARVCEQLSLSFIRV